jgi:hypothetical protein
VPQTFIAWNMESALRRSGITAVPIATPPVARTSAGARLAIAGPVLGHFGDVLHWQIGAFCAVWMVGGYWLVTRLTNWLWRSKPDSPIH